MSTPWKLEVINFDSHRECIDQRRLMDQLMWRHHQAGMQLLLQMSVFQALRAKHVTLESWAAKQNTFDEELAAIAIKELRTYCRDRGNRSDNWEKPHEERCPSEHQKQPHDTRTMMKGSESKSRLLKIVCRFAKTGAAQFASFATGETRFGE